MGKHFLLSSNEQVGSMVVMPLSEERALLFYQIAEMLEDRLQARCGITDHSEQDELWVDGAVFIHFFELFMKQDWQGEGVEHLWNWAEYAAGMIINITLEPRFWKNRHGPALHPIRYLLSDQELEEELSRKVVAFQSNKKIPEIPHPEFTQLDLGRYAHIIERPLL